MMQNFRDKTKIKIERIRSKIANPPFDISESIIIAGSPRAGTTWLMELISTLPKYVSIFEPLHKEWFPASKKVNFSPRTFICPNEEAIHKRKYLEKVFEGREISNKPHFKPSETLNRFNADKILAKFIRANRMLPWILSNFDLRGSILIIRHPCANIASQMRTGIRGYYLPNNSKLPVETAMSEARNIVTEETYKKLEKIKSRVGILATIWCLDQYIPLYFKEKFDFTLVSYEGLVMNPEKEINRILKKIRQQGVFPQIMDKISRPSMTTDELMDNKLDQLSKWKDYFLTSQIEDILSVVNIFGLDFYTEDIEPEYDTLYNWGQNDLNKSFKEIFDSC